MPPRTRGNWRRLGALLPDITFAIAIAATIATALWAAWRYGWLG